MLHAHTDAANRGHAVGRGWRIGTRGASTPFSARAQVQLLAELPPSHRFSCKPTVSYLPCRYANEFNNLLSAYQAANNIDLTRDHDPPSDNLYIRVNVLQDIGQFVGPESGVNIDLKRGDLSYLRRGDVEHLVRQGTVQQVV